MQIMPVMNGDSEGSGVVTMAAIKHEHVNMMPASAGGAPGGGGGAGTDQPPTPCGGCGLKIADRFYLVAVERAWHSDCLRCCECRRPLDTALSCFARQSRIYCRDDYYR